MWSSVFAVTITWFPTRTMGPYIVLNPDFANRRWQAPPTIIGVHCQPSLVGTPLPLHDSLPLHHAFFHHSSRYAGTLQIRWYERWYTERYRSELVNSHSTTWQDSDVINDSLQEIGETIRQNEEDDITIWLTTQCKKPMNIPPPLKLCLERSIRFALWRPVHFAL